MRVVVTGGAGLLGAHMSRHLTSLGHEVLVLDNLSGGYKEFVDDRSIFLNVDLREYHKSSMAFNIFKPEVVFHFAAFAAVCASPFVRCHTFSNNVIATSNIINLCVNHNVRKIIFASSMDVYGNVESPFTEAMTPGPLDPYGIAKYASELDIESASKQFGLEYNIIRPHNVFGIYQNIWDKYRNVIGIWINRILRDQPILIYGDGTQVRAFSDIKFYMEPFERLMTQHSGEIFNIGAENPCTLNDLANTVVVAAKKNGFNPKIEYAEKRDEVHTAYCDHSKAKEILNFKDDTNIEKLVQDMFVWAKNEPSRDVKIMSYEIEKNMYSYWKNK